MVPPCNTSVAARRPQYSHALGSLRLRVLSRALSARLSHREGWLLCTFYCHPAVRNVRTCACVHVALPHRFSLRWCSEFLQRCMFRFSCRTSGEGGAVASSHCPLLAAKVWFVKGDSGEHIRIRCPSPCNVCSSSHEIVPAGYSLLGLSSRYPP